MLGAVVALIKVAHMVSLEADTGLWAFAMLTVFMTIALSIDLRPFWRELGLTRPPAQADAADAPDAAAPPNDNASGEAHP